MRDRCSIPVHPVNKVSFGWFIAVGWVPQAWRGTRSICLTADHFGIRTVSITWIVPLEAAMSALTTVAPLIKTLPPTTLIVTD